MTVREVLLDELKTRNVRFGRELSLPLPAGRKAPDAVLANGANYVLETKVGDQADYWEDIKKLTEWIKIRTAPISGAFAVLLPGELREVPWESVRELSRSPKLKYEVSALFRDERPADRKDGSLSEIADWIAAHVLRPPREVVPDTDFVVHVLAASVGQLSLRMRGLSVKQFEDIFGGRLVFDNILEVKRSQLPIEDLRRAASYLLINQIIFYHVLSRADPTSFPIIDTDALSRPADLTEYFRKVLEVDYAPTFGFDIASRLSPNATDTVRSVVEIVQAMGLARIRHDVLGKVFHNLIPLAIRKPVAAYYTNRQAADLLSALPIRHDKDRVLDPACGSGTLLVSCYEQKRRLLEKSGHLITEKDHERFLNKEITGVDIMPFAAHLAVVHLAMQAPRFTTQRVRVGIWDSTELEPNRSIPSLTRELSGAFKQPTLDMFKDGRHPMEMAEYIEKGSMTPGGVGGDKIDLDAVDVVIMNPPFTSSDRLGAEYKKLLKLRFGSQYQSLLQGKIGFQGHFLLLADRFLKAGGRLAAVLPQTTLTGEAFAPIVKMIEENYTVCTVIVGLGRSAFSENTALSEILLVAEKKNPQRNHRFALVGTKTSPTEWSSDDVENLVSHIGVEQDYEDDQTVLRWVPQRELLVERGGLTKLLPRLTKGYADLLHDLSPVLRSPLMVAYTKYEKKSGVRAFMSSLGNREAPGPEGRGGVYFGTSALNICRDEKRALKKVDRLVLVGETSSALTAADRVSDARFTIPKSAVVPTVRRLSHYPWFDVSNATDILISRPFSNLAQIMQSIYGETKTPKFLMRIRERWLSRVKEGSTRLCLARRIDPGAPGTHHIALYTRSLSFTGHGGWGFRNLSNDDAKLLCLWFNSSLFLLQLLEQRTQTRGTWWRFDKHRFARTLIPDLTALRDSQRRRLLTVFEELREVAYPSILEQLKTSFEGRRKLDAAWLSVLGIPEKQQEPLSRAIHSYLYDTLSTLLGAMGKD